MKASETAYSTTQKDLYGWDVVYGSSQKIINDQLAKNSKELITEFDYTRKLSDDEGSIVLKGTFGEWSIVSGSDSLLHVKIPIKEGSMTVDGLISSCLKGTGYEKGKPFDISEISITIEVALAFKVDGDDSKIKKLKFNFKGSGDKPSKDDIPIKKLSDPKNKLKNDTLKGIFKETMAELLSANRDKISFVFAKVVDQDDDNKWFNTQYAQFYYSMPEGRDEGFMNILGMVYHDNDDGNPAKIDPAFTQDSSVQLYQAFTEDLFLNKVVQPLLPDSFGNGATSNSFAYDFDNHAIRNNGTLDIDKVSKGPVDFYPKIHSLCIMIDDEYLTIHFKGTCDLHIPTLDDMTFSYKSKNKVTYDSDKKKFIIHKDPNPEKDHDLDIAWWQYAAAAAAAALGVGIIFGLIIVVITDRVIASIAGDVGDESTSNYSISNLEKISMTWTGVGDDFQVISAGLNKNLEISGKV